MIPTIVITALICSDLCLSKDVAILPGGRLSVESAEPIKIYNIQVPNSNSSCALEQLRSRYVDGKLAEVLSGRKLLVRQIGRSVSGEALAAVFVDGYDLGSLMLETEWVFPEGKEAKWCK